MIPIAAVVFGIQQVLQWVQAGLSTGQTIADAVSAGRIAVEDASGRILSADEVRAACTKVQLAVLQAGDAAADRIEDRHRADATGTP